MEVKMAFLCANRIHDMLSRESSTSLHTSNTFSISVWMPLCTKHPAANNEALLAQFVTHFIIHSLHYRSSESDQQ